MKGIVFNLLAEVVSNEHGESTWDALLAAAGLDGAYTSLGNYPDEHLLSLVDAASASLGLEADSIVRWFGSKAIPLLRDRYPQFFQRPRCTREFLLTLNSIIHPEVRKLYPGADAPEFHFDTSSVEVLVMRYRSKRGLCALAEGLIEGTANHYGEQAFIEHSDCAKRGNPECVLRICLQTAE